MIFGDFWRFLGFLEIFEDFWRFLVIFGDFWRFLEMSGWRSSEFGFFRFGPTLLPQLCNGLGWIWPVKTPAAHGPNIGMPAGHGPIHL